MMDTYKVTLVFNDVDNNYYTKGKAEMTVEVSASDKQTVYFLAERLKKVMDADDWYVG